MFAFGTLALAAVVMVAAAPTAHQIRLIKALKLVLNNPNSSAADKKANLNATLKALGGDYKARFDGLISEATTAMNNISSPAARQAGLNLISMYQDGELFGGEQDAKAKVGAVFNSLNESDRKALQDVAGPYAEKFESVLKVSIGGIRPLSYIL